MRKRKIVDYVLQTRRQILKLLVLVRWSAEADNVAKCMVRTPISLSRGLGVATWIGTVLSSRTSQNIIGFLARQNFEFDRAVESLTEVKTMLAGARCVRLPPGASASRARRRES